MSETKKCGTVGLIGRPNVGKSSLLNAILGQKIAATTHKPQTTRKSLRGVHTFDSTQIVFVDTPGIHEPKAGLHAYMVGEALDSAKGVDVIALVVEPFVRRKKDIKEGQLPFEIDERDRAVLAQLEGISHKTPIVLVMNKVDRLPDRGATLALMARWKEQGTFAAVVGVSAETKRALPKLLEELSKALPQNDFMFPPDTLTDRSEKEITAELIREKAMLELQDELPYTIAVEIESFDEEERDSGRQIVFIEAVIHTERDSHKSMIIGKGGQRIKAIGIRSRKELEHLLGCQVMLKLFVHTEKDWTLKKHTLKRFGYN